MKLKPLQGRWMFFKSTGSYTNVLVYTGVIEIRFLICIGHLVFFYKLGGNGQRKLTLLTMDTEGYSVRQLRAASNNAKNVLFIVPLQQELDTKPLPYNAIEFSKMPQVPCHICSITMPLQMLALHSETCQPPPAVSCVSHQCCYITYSIATYLQYIGTNIMVHILPNRSRLIW